jgi:trigger factor
MPVAVEVTKLEDDRVKVEVTVPEDEVRKQFDRTVKEVSSRMRIPGFRPGKVPANVVIQRVGRDGIFAQTLDRALNDWYREALIASQIEPIGDPEVDMGEADEKQVAFAVILQVPPTPVLGTYKGLEAVREPNEVPEGAVQEEIDRVREQGARLEDTDRAAAEGDFMLIDYEANADGEPIEGASTRGQLIELGGERILPAFTEALVGAKAGDTKSFPVEYPDDDTRDEIKGKTIEYVVTVQKVQEEVLPELDDALAESVGFATAAELTTEIEERLTAATERTVEERYRRRVIDAAVAGATFDVPEVMVERRIDSILHDTSHQLPQGITLEQFLAMQGQTMQEARDSLRTDAEMSIRRELVIETIADAEGITLSDDEVEARVRTDAADAGRDPDELLKALRAANGWESLRQDLRIERAVDLVVESASAITPEEGEKREKAAEAKAAKPAAAKKPAADKPAAEKKPAAKKPAAAKTAAAKPAAEKKPAAKKPAASKSTATKSATPAAKGAAKPAAKKTAAAKPAAKKTTKEKGSE